MALEMVVYVIGIAGCNRHALK